MNQPYVWIRAVAFTGLTLAAFALGSFANQKSAAPTKFASNTIDLGIACSNVDKSLKFYKDVLGFTEVQGFKVPGQYAEDAGLANKHELDVHVLVLGEGETATKLKLMQFKTAPGAQVDNTFVHSSYGFRYLTIFVSNLNTSLEQANKNGGKLVAKTPLPLPEGFPAGMGLAIYRDPDGNMVELVGPWKK